ncbi:phospholipase D [Irpex rosettiformis]|uniref:Phospholipase D n=1 Tax=Irpex rosettiformis TaxID=378272 RepID=A0ACB8TSI2_9APHY|nr:phospholipase D [Irpex rosettiformis]
MRSPTLSAPKSSLIPRPTRRTKSLPQLERDEKDHDREEHNVETTTAPKWGRLRSLIPHLAQQRREQAAKGPSVVAPQSVNITDELLVGGLSTLMLRLWFERDEKGHRRIPVLLHRLRIRVSDSLHPLHGNKAVFRIECEYANGAARWVVYRQLKDFLSLHTHYTISNAYNRNVDALPDFPRAGLPYFNFLKERGSGVSRREFARMQRESLENYLVGLIRSVMFHPAANRLASFLEISALSITLAQSGGAQYKAGLLRIEAVTNKGPWGKRGTGWKDKKKRKWCAVRESYFVVLEEMGELSVYDAFLVDSDFRIERPKRYYRQGLNLLTHPDEVFDEEKGKSKSDPNHDARSQSGNSIKSRFSRIFSRKSCTHQRTSSDGNAHENGTANSRPSRARSSSTSSDASTSSSEDEGHRLARQITPMLDPSTNTNPLEGLDEKTGNGKSKKKSGDVSKHTFYIENAQMRLKCYAKNERQMLQWIAALEKVATESHYTGANRFDSFAPIRLNVAAQWLVDGRDYFWNMSRAILLAKECIYIHDWWLSPELHLRRPHMDKYSLDRLLERKAKEGVKIYVILYQEVSSRTTPTDSNYAKQRLSNLHPNIMVQRSPSHFQTGTFYWAHHEKLCVIDQVIAFMGGLDACFGRWDTPQHVLTDDPDSGDLADAIWPGKDYSNPRVLDFHTLNKPQEDMYDRTKVPRMPWHDVAMQIVGQPARDLSRHFVQRWNYLLRIKNHTRPMPTLLPPPEFKAGELSQLGLTGTCELQICRSAGPWSLGTPDRIEHSIQNAYLKAIQMSEHFVYIENQFFISSTVVNEVKIENKIGDAIFHRILRAHREETPFKCCIVIPLLPGFTYPVDHSDASAIRIILECQNRTICRGPNSIYGRLRKEGIDPDNYITVFSLRNWGKLRGDVLTTEQASNSHRELWICIKFTFFQIMIVDDRLAIIGSANINERSQRGDRDSELAAVIRDTDLIDGTMAGKPFKVGRFAHTLRVRLMREHLGVDVDSMYEEDLMASDPVKPANEQDGWDPDVEQEYGKEDGVTHVTKGQQRGAKKNTMRDVVDEVKQAIHGTGDVEANDMSKLMRKTGLSTKNANDTAPDAALEEERQIFTTEGEEEHDFTNLVIPTLEEKLIAEMYLNDNPGENGDMKATENGHADPAEMRVDGELMGAPANSDPTRSDRAPGTRCEGHSEVEEKAVEARGTIRRQLGSKLSTKAWTVPTPTPYVDPHGFEDPICEEFWKRTWVACAVHNTEIYRKVFHAIPDDTVTTWKQYKEFVVHHERLNKPVSIGQSNAEPVGTVPSETEDNGAPRHATDQTGAQDAEETAPTGKDSIDAGDANGRGPVLPNAPNEKEPRARKASKIVEPFDQTEREEMERLLEELRGHLVLYPTRFLEGEDIANNFLFNADRLLPLPIYD